MCKQKKTQTTGLMPLSASYGDVMSDYCLI